MPSAPYSKPAVRAGWCDTGVNSTTGDIYDPDQYESGAVTSVTKGWSASSTPPARQFMNWVLNYCMDGIRYLCAAGVATWDTLETYVAGNLTIGSDQKLYQAKAQSTGQSPLNYPSVTTYWGIPQVPTAPTLDYSYNIANTAFVTSAVASGVNSAETYTVTSINTLLASSDTFTGNPTFSGNPYLSGAATVAAPASESDNTTRIPSTAWVQALLATQFTGSLTGNGYYQFSGGLIIKWGVVLSSSGSTASVTYPSGSGGAFPNATLIVIPVLLQSSVSAPATGVAVTPLASYPTASGFNAVVGNSGFGFYWLAIGH